MPDVLPCLRHDLDFLPSPVPEQPGLLLRDPYRYSDAILIVPPPLIPALRCFDGQQTEADLRHFLVRLTGSLDVSPVIAHLTEALGGAGFLQDSHYRELRDRCHRAFADAELRDPAHAGSAYPDDAAALRAVLDQRWLVGTPPVPVANLRAIAAPHVSPEGGVDTYRAAYLAARAAWGVDDGDRTFVVLGTSHYGQPDRFGLTRKPYLTPLGSTGTRTDLVQELSRRAPQAVLMEDYCHATEHSIEFQVVFLQHLFGPAVKVLPILCGPFLDGMREGGTPEDSDAVRAFLDTLGDITAREGQRLCYVLGVDMAHIGRRYGDELTARANEGVMTQVAEADAGRIESLLDGDASGFWMQVRENRDVLRWCGASPLYAFSRVQPSLKGSLLEYQHWNIDDESVVSFAAMAWGD